jgi:hypothetical protein
MNEQGHDSYRDEIGAYVLGALSELEVEAFERHMAACERCSEEVVRLRVAADALPRSVTPLAPPPSLKKSLMRVVAKEAGVRAPRRRLRDRISLPAVPRLSPAAAWATAAVLVAVGVLGGVGASLLVDGEDGRTIAADVDRSRLPQASASLVVPGADDEAAVLRVQGMPIPAGRRVYQVWYRRGREIVPGTVFSVRSDGTGAAAIPQGVKGVREVMVTRELIGGARAPSEEPVLRVRTS